MVKKSCPFRGILPLAIGLVSGCASGNLESPASYDVDSDRLVEMVVLNQTDSPMIAFAWWESGARVRLGQLRGGANETFTTPYRGTEVWLSLEVLAGRGAGAWGRGVRPQTYVHVAPGDRIAWEIRSTAPVDLLHRRLPR